MITLQHIPQSKTSILTKFAMSSMPQDTLISAFQKTGIYPVNRAAITPDLLVGDDPVIPIRHEPIHNHPGLLMEAYDEDDNRIDRPSTSGSDGQEPLSQAPVSGDTLVCSNCQENDVSLHPAVAAGAVSLELAKAFIPDTLGAAKPKIPNRRSKKEPKSRWLTSASEIERRRQLKIAEEEKEKMKEKRKEERNLKKAEKERMLVEEKNMRSEKRAQTQSIKKAEREQKRIEEKNMRSEKRARTQSIRKAKVSARKGLVEEEKCYSCKRSDLKGESVVRCVICDKMYHRECIEESSLVFVCAVCTTK